jgi:thiamine pyrophosphokinase
MSKRAVILANGLPPKKELLLNQLKEEAFLICADGGANTAAKLGLRPDLIIGDLDSILASTVRTFSKIRTRRMGDQNSTDLEKALAWAVRGGYTDIVVMGATGGRLDHLTGNLSALGKFARKARVAFVDNFGELSAVGSELVLDVPAGTTVSLIPLSRCEGIVTSGLKWELRNGTLEMGVRDGISNVVMASPATISVRRGTLLLYRIRPQRNSG